MQLIFNTIYHFKRFYKYIYIQRQNQVGTLEETIARIILQCVNYKQSCNAFNVIELIIF
jgi:hypothetical protein